MKYAILGPRHRIIMILDQENSDTTPISNVKAQQAEQIREQKQVPFLIDGQVTNPLIEAQKGNYMRWNIETKSWEIKPIPVKVPQAMTAWQAKAALKLTERNGKTLFELVEQAIDAISENQQKTVIKTAWQYNANFDRKSQTISSIAAALALTDKEIDDLFILGASFELN